MLLNVSTALTWPSHKISLYPYRKEHVARYHAWMSDPELRLLTASDELTLEEEYEMQASWQQDVDKLTFIIAHDYGTELTTDIATAVSNMVGDVNLFLSEISTDGEDEASETGQVEQDTIEQHLRSYTGELELMIAEPTARGKGIVVTTGELVRFSVKISEDNTQSLRLFENIGFRRIKFATYFREWELQIPVNGETEKMIESLMRLDQREIIEHSLALW